MESFLKEIAAKLRENHPDDLDQVTVVFNNRRSGLFLRRQFAQMGEQPFFLPQIMGMDELVAQLGGLEIVPNEFILFELFDIHRNLDIKGRRFDTFEQFISFGDMMMSDFSEIDLYMADAKQLFSNLHDIKTLQEWDVELGSIDEAKNPYLDFYKSLYQYYTKLHERLSSQGKAYSGMAYRYVAEKIESLSEKIRSKHIYFIGFNALSACEENIILHYVKRGMGTLYSDGDAYYFDDRNQEAGFFLNKHKADFPSIGNYENHFSCGHKNITIVSCPESVIQTKYAGELLAQKIQKSENNQLERTALVLADESLLLPALNALPQQITTANVTMGFPFVGTSVHTLILKLFSLHQRRRGSAFYHQDVLDILSDYCITRLLQTEDMHALVSAHLSKGHFIYITCETIKEICPQAKDIMFLFCEEEPSPKVFFELTQQLITALYGSKCLDTNLKEKEALACLQRILDYFQEIQQRYNYIDTLKVLQKIYLRLAQRRSVAFYGEPLQGLQILGMLETRNLDFQNIILLSANEGTLPSGRRSNSLIPYFLRVAFKIPTYHEKDAVYAYNFYRLIQRAENIHILYTTDTNGIGKGEPSRFILQLRNELAKRYPENITINEEVLSASNSTPQIPIPDTREKSEAIAKLQRSLAERGLSPSALNNYRNCPLKFYYENILSIRENDEVSDEMDQSELGTCIHNVLENAYKPFVGKNLTKEALQKVLDNLDTYIDEALKEQFQHGRNHEGRNHLLESVAKTQLSNFLKGEIKQLEKSEIKIVGLEQDPHYYLNVDVGGENVRVKIYGRYDRIDIKDGILRIVDYKTGRVEEKDLIVKDANPDLMNVSDKWFQVMTYAWLYQRNKNESQSFVSGIMPLGRLSAELMGASWEEHTVMNAQQIDKFEELLKKLVANLMDPKIPFEANHESKSCNYCPFAETCQQKMLANQK